MSAQAIIDDAPGLTPGERLGFTTSWFAARARASLDTARHARLHNMPRMAALHREHAASWRADALAAQAGPVA